MVFNLFDYRLWLFAMEMSSSICSTDEKLVAESLAGNTGAFQTLVERYEGIVAKTVYGMLGNSHADADDIGQEVMLRLYHSLDRFRGDASLKTYITRIAMNLCLDTLRKEKRKRRWLTPLWRADDDAIEPVSNDVQPRDITHIESSLAISQVVERSLSMLPTEQRSVLILRLLHGYSTEETASMLNIANGTVLSRLSRARAKFIQQLAHYGYDFEK